MKLKIKIAVAANADGEWAAYGFPGARDWNDAMDSFDSLDGEQRFWVEAEIEVADDPPVIAGAALTDPFQHQES